VGFTTKRQPLNVSPDPSDKVLWFCVGGFNLPTRPAERAVAVPPFGNLKS